MHVEPRLQQRPTTPRISTSGCFKSFARSACHDDRGAVVGLDAAIEQMQRLADEAAVDHVLDREALLVIGLRVVERGGCGTS
jgi:hypothetical protein